MLNFVRVKNHKYRAPTDYKPIENYGIIGNMETVALVANDGSIEWMCLPHLEDKSVFASLLDKNKGGVFELKPKGNFKSHQEYDGPTNILKTFFETQTGKGEITDFMPPFKKSKNWHKQQILIRRVKVNQGYINWRLVFQPRFNYANYKPKITACETGVEASHNKEKLFLDAPLIFKISSNIAEADFTLAEGQEVWLLMQYGTRSNFTIKELEAKLKETYNFWDNWRHKCELEKCVFNGPWHDLVDRSALVLKLLTHGETGAIAAAATTSLPEVIGGKRNWDYRFNWLRDSVFTVQALYNAGKKREAIALFNWYKKLYKGVKVRDIQIMYGLHGEKDLTEKSLRHLQGYKNSKPVRIGNLAKSQLQFDVYGEILNVAFETSRYGESLSKNDWKLLKKIVNYVCKNWHKKDSGIWEVRGQKKHFVFSKVMCWVAIDRGIKIAEKRNFKGPLQKWGSVKEEIEKSILKNGFNKKLNSFVQSYNSKYLDAANLLIPIVGFLPFEDPRIKGTIEATIKHLTASNGFVYRYKSPDGLSGKEGAFIVCSFWLADCLALSGQVQKAEKLFVDLIKNVSPLGLLAEQIDPVKKTMLGNFPQALSHIGLINTALYLGLSKGKMPPGPSPLGLIGSKILSLLMPKNIFNLRKLF